MGCCFSCGSSNESSNPSKETVYKFENEGFDKSVSKKQPTANVSDTTAQSKKKELVIPNISVTLASSEIHATGVENEGYEPSSGVLGLDDYEEYPNYEPLRRMSADIREQKKKDEEKALREKEAQITKMENEESHSDQVTKEQNDHCTKGNDENMKKDSLQSCLKGSRKRDDSEASFNTVYHTVMEPSEEIVKINEEDIPSKTTITVEVHSSSSNSSDSELPQASTIELPEDASRKFSQLAPAPKDSPLAHQVGQFSVTPTEGQASPKSSLSLKPTAVHSQLSSLRKENTISVEEESTSRKFSQLAPAPSNSPHAVQVGGKFTMIPTEAKH